ncbi:MAG: hypothetical protein EXR69_10650 [Myxococcales bacterium]|nr:hypothetical protein [Myxococcales bacterium]
MRGLETDAPDHPLDITDDPGDWLGETGWRPGARGLWRLVTSVFFAVRPALGVLLAYGLSTVAFSSVSARGGLLTPDASVDPVVVGLGLLALSLRLTVLWVALPIAAGRVVAAVVGLAANGRS